MVGLRYMTEDEHIELVEVGNSFWEELGDLAARYIAQMPKEIENEVTMYLQDMCSIYGTRYDKLLTKYRKLI